MVSTCCSYCRDHVYLAQGYLRLSSSDRSARDAMLPVSTPLWNDSRKHVSLNWTQGSLATAIKSMLKACRNASPTQWGVWDNADAQLPQ